MKTWVRTIRFGEPHNNEYDGSCPSCGAPDAEQADLGAVQPELVRGDHSIELYLRQCDNCENFWLLVYDDFPSA